MKALIDQYKKMKIFFPGLGMDMCKPDSNKYSNKKTIQACIVGCRGVVQLRWSRSFKIYL